MDSLEEEFVYLCRNYFTDHVSKNVPTFDREPEEISQFLSKLLQKHQKIQITDEVLYYIPLLAQYKDGILCPILETCVEGVSPLHFVPQLSLQVVASQDDLKNHTKNKKSGAPRRYKNNNSIPNTTRNHKTNLFKDEYNNANQNDHTFKKIEDIGSVPKITLPPHQTARNIPTTSRPHYTRQNTRSFKQPLPPLKNTQDNVLPTLYINDKQNFYMAQKANKDSLDFNILPPDYPDQMISDDYAVLSPSGVIMLNGDRASVVDLDQFYQDIRNEYIVERSSFRLRYSYRFFYTWRERYRDRLFRKKIRLFDQKGAVANVGFSQFLDKIRENVISTTDPMLQIYTHEFDFPTPNQSSKDQNKTVENTELKSSEKLNNNNTSESPNTSNVSTSSTTNNNGDNTADFSELIDVASESIEKIDNDVRLMGEDTCRRIAEVFKNVRSANLLMQLDFDELNSLNSLPASLQAFKSDLKWRVPSLHRQRLRETVLKRERKLAGERQDYIQRFFNRIRTFYSGLLIVQCKKCLMNFLYRFSSRSTFCQNKLNMGPEKVKIRINKLVASFDAEKGMKIYPSRSLFLNWLERTTEQITDAFISENKHINVDVIADIDPEYEFETENPKTILSLYKDLKSLKADSLSSMNEVYDYIDHEISTHSNFLKNLKNLSDEAISFENFRKCDEVQSMINNLINSKQSLSKRPKTIYHTLPENRETINFVVDMKPSFEEAGSILNNGIKIFQNNIVADLNQQFSEIQETWAKLKDTVISKENCNQLELKLVLFVTLSDLVSSAWSEIKPEIHALVDTIMGFYRGLNDKSSFTSPDLIKFFNRTCQKMEVSSLLIEIHKHKAKDKSETKDDGYEYEYEYEEEDDNEAKSAK